MIERPGNGAPLDAECVRAVERTGLLLQSLGHRVELSHPDAFDDSEIISHFERVIYGHASQTIDFIGRMLGRPLKPEDVEPYTWRLAAEGAKVSLIEYITGADWLHGWSRRMAAWWAQGFDLLVTRRSRSRRPASAISAARAETRRLAGGETWR
jgi:amidase